MRRPLLFACLTLLLVGSACRDENNTFIVNSDCGLVRTDLLGEWSVSFSPATARLFNCSDPSFNNTSVGVTSLAFVFNDVEVFASAANVGFQFRDSSSPAVIFGNIETDSCQMLFAFLDNEGQYLQCIGTFNRNSGVLHGTCDSTTVLQTPVTDPPAILADCDLDPVLTVTLDIQ